MVVGFLGGDDADEALGDIAQELQADPVQHLVHDLRVGRVLAAIDPLQLVPGRHQKGQRVDLERRVLVRVDEGVDQVDVAADRVLQQLLARAELASGEDLHGQADIRRLDIRLDLLEHLVAVMLDRQHACELERPVRRGSSGRQRDHDRGARHGPGQVLQKFHCLLPPMLARLCRADS